MRYLLRLVVFLLVVSSAGVAAQTIVNAGFEEAEGRWGDRDGPAGWTLRLKASDDQRGVVESHDFVKEGRRAFRFTEVARGFGDSRLEQCVPLGELSALQLSAQVRVEEPDPELAVRLRVDFYADDDCETESAAAGEEQIETSIGLSAERTPAGEWARLESEVRLPGELGDDVRAARISLRQRDRSNDGQPRDPLRQVWFDDVSLAADIRILPPGERAALRDLYNATSGDSWLHRLGWMGPEGTECSWQGVECSKAGDTVVGLDLAGNGLLGELPGSLVDLEGLRPGEGLDVCWNDVLVPLALEGFVADRHVGGDPGFCQGLTLQEVHAGRSGSYFQPADRSGEGFMLHMLSAGSAVLAWAGYDDSGQPLWLTASGRARDRVLRFDDVYHTRMDDGQPDTRRVGRASLVFVDDDERPGCSLVVMRFFADGDGYGAGDGREMVPLDGASACGAPDVLPAVAELEGHWFDPALPGQGLSLVPLGENMLWLNWMGHDEDGEPLWMVGAGRPDSSGLGVEFEPLYSVSGGSFNDFINPGDLEYEFHAPALLWRHDEGGPWQFQSNWLGEDVQLDLQRIDAGPDLLASTGHRIDLFMEPEDVEALYSRSPHSDERLPGTIHFDGSAVEHGLTGLRFRGRSTRTLPKKSYNIRFEQPQPLLFDSDRMNLNGMYTDPAMMRESLAFQMFHELERPASLTRYFDLWINKIYEGTFVHVSRVDGHLVEHYGLNPDGTLVRDRVRDSGLEEETIFAVDLGEMTHDERLDFLRDNFKSRNDPHWPALLELVEWAQSTPPGATFAEEFEQRIDVDTFVDWMVIHWLIGDIDAWNDDFWLYLDHDDPEARWVFIPWDKDLSFGSHYRPGFYTANNFFAYEYPLPNGQSNPLLRKAIASPSIRQRLDERMAELMQTHFTPAWFAEQIAVRKERLADSINIAPGPTAFDYNERNHHDTEAGLHDQVEAIEDFVGLRYAYIQRYLDKASGIPYQAQGDLQAESRETLFLTDPTGFTIATVEPQEALTGDTSYVIEVQPVDGLVGIDREWRLEVDGDGGPFELTLFYRNELDSYSWLGDGNWWTGGFEPVGRQRGLVMEMAKGFDGFEILPTRINPISNKAVVNTELTAGEYRFRLVLLPTLSSEPPGPFLH